MKKRRSYNHKITTVRFEVYQLLVKVGELEGEIRAFRTENAFLSNRIREMYDEFNTKIQNIRESEDAQRT